MSAEIETSVLLSDLDRLIAERDQYRAEWGEAARHALRWQAEYDKAQQALDRWEENFPCDGGCSVEPYEGPQEDCSRDGRRPRDLWNLLDEARAAIVRVEALCDQADDGDYTTTFAGAVRAALRGDG